jgi:hypothetical protein
MFSRGCLILGKRIIIGLLLALAFCSAIISANPRMVYFVAGLLLVPSLWPCHELYKLTARMNPDRTVMLEEIGG